MGFLDKINYTMMSTLSNKSAREDTVKYFSRMSRKLAHSTNMCFTVSEIPLVTSELKHRCVLPRRPAASPAWTAPSNNIYVHTKKLTEKITGKMSDERRLEYPPLTAI